MAKVLPLTGKYYGTCVQFKTPDGQTHDLKIWASDHFAEHFGSHREIANGWTPEDGHDHVEDEQSLRIANIIANALTAEGL